MVTNPNHKLVSTWRRWSSWVLVMRPPVLLDNQHSVRLSFQWELCHEHYGVESRYS